MNQGKATNYPSEVLNSLSANSTHAHQIRLKVCVPVMILRNTTPPNLCNETTIKKIRLQRNIMERFWRGRKDIHTTYTTHSQQFLFQFQSIQFSVSVNRDKLSKLQILILGMAVFHTAKLK